MIQTITSLKNDLVKRAASLKVKKYRQREGLFLLEGKRAVEEALASGWKLQCLFYTKLPAGWEERAQGSALPWYEVPLPVLQKITATEDPPERGGPGGTETGGAGSLCSGEGPGAGPGPDPRPGNLGTLIRTADALGAVAVVLMENTADLYNPKVVRSTMGSLFHLPVFHRGERGPAGRLVQKTAVRPVGHGPGRSRRRDEAPVAGKSGPGAGQRGRRGQWGVTG